jgi:hypothetical protein
MNVKKIVFMLVLLALLIPGAASAYSIYLPVVVAPPKEECYRLDAGYTLYCSPKHFTVLGTVRTFTSSTYYGYFSRATSILDVDTGIHYKRLVSFECSTADTKTFLALYEGKMLFVQHLITKSKITVYE